MLTERGKIMKWSMMLVVVLLFGCGIYDVPNMFSGGTIGIDNQSTCDVIIMTLSPYPANPFATITQRPYWDSGELYYGEVGRVTIITDDMWYIQVYVNGVKDAGYIRDLSNGVNWEIVYDGEYTFFHN